jgi:16S rRNA (cytosine967-C5)-methyltransferase
VKFLRRPADLRSLAIQQNDILAGLWPLLKEGGQLLYATCSIFREENDEVVQGFLDNHPDAQIQVLTADWGVATRHGRQVLPSPEGPDGLYYAVLIKDSAAN